jgi:hypothetical protein
MLFMRPEIRELSTSQQLIVELGPRIELISLAPYFRFEWSHNTNRTALTP